MNKRLNVIDVSGPPTSSSNRRVETETKFERLWKHDPQRFNPLRDCRERERMARTKELIDRFLTTSHQEIVDLGCGSGYLAKWLADKGHRVLAVDVAPTALAQLNVNCPATLTTAQDCLPKTMLHDDRYDVVLCTDVIAYLHQNQYRLLFSELARLVHAKGLVVCSTPIDIRSDDALLRFGELAETEFDILEWCFSYDALYIYIQEWLALPTHYAHSWKDALHRTQESDKRHGIRRWWFRLNTSRPIGWIWALLQYPLQPLLHRYLQSHFVLSKLEKWCQFFWSDAGISHAIFIARRRPLIEPQPREAIPQERKHKREVWE